MDLRKRQIENNAGVAIILINSIWILRNVHFLYMYNFTSKLWLIMIPNKILIINTFLGLIGLLVGYKLKSSKLTLWQGIVLSVFLVIIGILIELKVIPYQ